MLITFLVTTSAGSDRKIAFPSDLLIFALPSRPGKRETCDIKGLISLRAEQLYILLKLLTISFACSINGS